MFVVQCHYGARHPAEVAVFDPEFLNDVEPLHVVMVLSVYVERMIDIMKERYGHSVVGVLSWDCRPPVEYAMAAGEAA